MPASDPRRYTLFALLLLLMVATRFAHSGSASAPPDASWAVFFLGGFYLSREWRWALASLFVAVVGADALAINHYGVSNYCATLAYWFIVPAYTVLWLGGAWLCRHHRHAPLDLVRLLASLGVSVTLCFGITHSAFYWLSGRIAHPNLTEWASVFVQWYPLFLGVTGLYVVGATAVHIAFTHRAPAATLQAPPELLAAADTVTDMRAVKHAFEAGVRAQRGIEP